ncbi:MAG: hypothetical protein M3N97_15795 [Pseudomonadota bacterium]|nr:hypothetical protein [Pseudomonadota bacterium]
MQISKRSNSRLLIASAAILTTVACSSVNRTYVPDGRRGFAITCEGLLNGWSSCLIKAGRACGNSGYETIKGSEEDRSMLIACTVPKIAAAPEHAAR